jgi:hypothetical protein
MESTDTIEALNQRILARTIELREDNFRKGFPFMMFAKELSEGEAYLEYSDGHIELTRLEEKGDDMVSKVVKTLSKEEADRFRAEYWAG